VTCREPRAGPVCGQVPGRPGRAVVGDALGAAFEGHPGPVPLDDVQKLERGQTPLAYTDDTAMTLVLAESLLASGGLTQDRLAAAFARSWRREPNRGYRASTADLLRRVGAEEAWDAASRSQFDGQGSFGNGAAMRVAPAALYAGAQAATTAILARRSAMVTHAHPLAIDGAAVQAVAVAVALAHPASGPLRPEDLLADVSTAATETLFAERLSAVVSLLPVATPTDAAEQLGTGVAAHEAVPAAKKSSTSG
jgi:poly(ADP-ribose) glycohydrolase ARH3